MTLYLNGELWALIIFSILFCAMCGWGIHASVKGRYGSLEEVIGTVVGVIGGIIGVVLVVCLGFFIIGFFQQQAREPVYFEKSYQQQQSLQAAINSTEDIVNTDLYLRAVDFNADLARLQAAQSNPNYSISFSGKVDWTTIPFIEVGG